MSAPHPHHAAAAAPPAARRAAPRAAVLLAVAALLCALAPTAVGAPEASAPGHGWKWPLDPRPAVVRPFDPPARPWLSGHRGVDLAAGPGAGVVAPQAGTVSFSGWVVDRPVVTIDHGGGLRSSFEPVEGTVPVGSVVATGATVGVLATAAAAHCERSPCLHWGVRRGEEYVDPVSFIEDRRPSVLLPWDGPR